ncbi:MAG: 2-isopropylmalate synthase, partial [Acidobacteria bacterium]|nr:2-isopropylmalate synthase [Acidobacteriota bacterium]
VLIDFSAPAALAANLSAARGAAVPIVVGTTGLTAEHHRMIEDAAAAIPVLQAANMSLGVNLLVHLVREAAARLAEEWDIDWLIDTTVKAVEFAVGENLPVMMVTEDTIRAKPQDIEKLYTAAIEAGASRVCVCDTVGHATPWGARNLVRFVRELVDRVNPEVGVDWHGHSDRGLGVINTIAALEAGADRVHGCAIGIGERVGNTPLDQLMVNLKLMGWIDNDLRKMPDYLGAVSRATGVPVPDQYPVFGRDAFRTGTGVHAAAIIKAKKKGSDWLADRVYSGVPAELFGLEQIIEIGPMCGLSNVQYWLDHHGYGADEQLAKALFEKAKKSDRILTDEELHQEARGWQSPNMTAPSH